MSWFFVAIFSYSFFAVSALVDRYLLAGPLPRPLVYTFYIGIFGILGTVFVPFGFFIPEAVWIGASFLAGGLSIAGLFMLYHSIFYGNVSRIVPMTGALVPIFMLGLSFGIDGGEKMSVSIIYAFVFLIIGAFLLSVHTARRAFSFSLTDILHVIIIAFLFAASFVLAKIVYENTSFVSGFVWMRWGGFLSALFLLFVPSVRETVFGGKNPLRKKRVSLPLLLGNVSGSLGSLLQQYAIALVPLGKLAFVSALQGTQYIFLLVFVFFIARFKPALLKEETGGFALPLRIVGILFLGVGLYYFFIGG